MRNDEMLEERSDQMVDERQGTVLDAGRGQVASEPGAGTPDKASESKDQGVDKVFDEPTDRIGDFTFGTQVATVFDDMVSRSVPFYDEIQRMIAELAADFAAEDTSVYDLGCSTGTTLINLDRVLPRSVRMVGVDESEEMLAKCRSKLVQAGVSREYELVCRDLNEGPGLENASLAVMCLVLQFIRPIYREAILNQIYRGLGHNGCFILVEKVLGEDSLFNRLFIEHYYGMKRRHHYSDLEIAQKREALENVLIPYKLSENLSMLKQAGFRYVEVFFKWYNFCGIVAVK